MCCLFIFLLTVLLKGWTEDQLWRSLRWDDQLFTVFFCMRDVSHSCCMSRTQIWRVQDTWFYSPGFSKQFLSIINSVQLLFQILNMNSSASVSVDLWSRWRHIYSSWAQVHDLWPLRHTHSKWDVKVRSSSQKITWPSLSLFLTDRSSQTSWRLLILNMRIHQ